MSQPACYLCTLCRHTHTHTHTHTLPEEDVHVQRHAETSNFGQGRENTVQVKAWTDLMNTTLSGCQNKRRSPSTTDLKIFTFSPLKWGQIEEKQSNRLLFLLSGSSLQTPLGSVRVNNSFCCSLTSHNPPPPLSLSR